MKHFNFLLIASLLLFTFTEVKCQINNSFISDEVTKCENIKEGKFLQQGVPITRWVMTVKDNVQTEYYNEGKDYVRSRLEFIDDCNYKVIVVAKSDEKNPAKLGQVAINKIVATERNLIKIMSECDHKTTEFVFDKVEEDIN